MKPVRTPVTTPVRIPITSTDYFDADDQTLIDRIQNKVKGLPATTETFEPAALGGLSTFVLSAQADDDVTQDELDDKINSTLRNKGSDPTWDAMTGQLIRSSCAFTAQEILTGPAGAPYFGRFLIGEHHLAWDELIAKHRRLCILAARDHGKCGRGDELLLTPQGDRIRLDQWRGGQLLVWDDLAREFTETYVPPAIRNGVKEVYRVRTRTGRELYLTGEHPLRTWDSWTAVQSLKPGDRVAVARELSGIGRERFKDAWLLGLVVGDGGLTGSNVTVTVADAMLLTALLPVVSQKGWRLNANVGDISYRLVRSYKSVETAPAWSRRLGISGHKAHDKFVPDQIFKAVDTDIAEFCAGYFDADGSVGWCTVEYDSVSKRLLKDVQHLLTRLGIVSRLNKKNGQYQGQPHKSWRLVIGSEYLLRFAEKIKLRSSKGIQLQNLIDKQRGLGVCSGKCIDLFPKAAWGELVKSGDWHRKQGTRPNKQYSPTRTKLQKIADQENNQELKSWLNAPIFWDEVAEVQKEPQPIETWALCVPKYHTYLADDVVNHNTFFVDFAYPIWKVINLPRGSGFIFSSTQDQAERILTDIRTEIETNPKLQWLIPTIKDRWGSRHIRCSNGHRIYARGFGTRVRGAHPDWIVVDDGLNDETAYSELVRSKQKDYFYTAITNMIVPHGQILVIGCVTPDTWVLTEKGYTKIANLNPGDDTPKKLYDIDLAIAGRNGLQRANKYWVQGVVPVKRVILEYGYELTGSHKHPFLVMNKQGIIEWRRADALIAGDMVAVKYGMNLWGSDITLPKFTGDWRSNNLDFPDVLTEDLAYLLGLWTAEGSYERTGRVMISNTEKPIRDWLLTHPFNMLFAENKTEGSQQTLRCSAKAFLNLIEFLGGKLGTASKKVVPEKLMSAPKNIVRAFLRGLFDGDGNVWVKNNTQQVMIGSVSKELIRMVQLLLLNFGILASLGERLPAKPTRKVPGGGKYPLFTLGMTGREAYEFMTQIGFSLPRKQLAVNSMQLSSSKCRGVPFQAANIQLARQEKVRRKKGSLPSSSVNISAAATALRMEKRTLQEIADWFYKCGSRGSGYEGMLSALAGQLAWFRVKKIEDSEQFTVDFVIDGDHSFLTNGIVSHNTPFHADDLYADLKKNPEYHFASFPAESNPGQPGNRALWEDRYPLAQLEKRKAEIGSIRYTREFLCEPVSDDMSLFPLHLFQGLEVEQYNLTLGMPLAFWQQAGVKIYMGVDFAMSSNVQADYTVIWVVGIDGHGNRWLIDMERAKGLPYQQQLSLINTLGRKYDPSLIFLEDNQMQRIFGDELIRTSDLPVKKFTTGAQKNSLDKGVPSLRILLENQKFRIPRGNAETIEKIDTWIEEMRSITWVDGKIQSVGSHDDTVMALWICDQAIRAGGFQFSFGNEKEYELSAKGMDELMAELTGSTAEKPTPEQTVNLVG